MLSFDLIPDPVAIIGTTGIVLDVNEAMTALAGQAKGVIIGADCRTIEPLGRVWKTVPPPAAGFSEDVGRITFRDHSYEVLTVAFSGEGTGPLVRVIFKDITNFDRLEKELLKRNKELIIINTLSSAFISSENIDLVLEDIIDKVMLIADFPAGWLLLRDGDRLRLRTSRGISPGLQKRLDAGEIEPFCEDALRSGEPITVIEQQFIRSTPLFRDEGISFLVAVPLVADKKTTGLLFLASRVGRDFDFDFASLLSLVGNHVSHIVDKIKLFQETKRLSITDGLTGLYNSRYFYKTLDSEIARTRRYGSSFSLILFDIDNFKALNDTYGHQAGDDVLQELAKILKSVSRTTDTVVRYGGEEFVIILPNTAEAETDHLANRIRYAVQQNLFSVSATEQVTITLSGGIASFPQNASTAKELLLAADTALYAAKSAGKNTIICYQGKINETAL